jgi:DNA-damage-inducible protein J
MTANAVVRARIEEGIKKEASIVLEAMGLTVSDALRMMLIRIAREKSLPFEPLVPNAKTIARIKRKATDVIWIYQGADEGFECGGLSGQLNLEEITKESKRENTKHILELH